MASMNPELAAAIIASAKRLGVNPMDIGTAISYETGGKFDPNLWGGKNGNYLGLIQFGPEERAKYGVKEGQTAPEQMQAVENFLRDRGVKPGMGLMDIYSTINAGSPGLYNRSDAANGGAPGTVADKVNSQMAGHAENAARLLSGPVGALDAAAPAAPPMQLESASVGALAAPPTLSGSLAGLGNTLNPAAAPGAAPPAAPAQPDFAPLQQLQVAQPHIGQSQQLASAIARAYGIG